MFFFYLGSMIVRLEMGGGGGSVQDGARGGHGVTPMSCSPTHGVIWLWLAHEFNRMPPTSVFDSSFFFV